ncbi:MAG: OmpA family protein [Pseudomonadota bacterium]
MKIKQQIFAATLLVLGVTSAPAALQAGHNGVHHGYGIEHHHPHRHNRDLTLGQAYEIQKYFEYEEREPCQNYRAYPEGLRPGTRCGGPDSVIQTEMRILPVIARYEIYFDLNKSGIRADQVETLNKLERELKTYNPAQITVTGHADTSGPAGYNQKLSGERAMSVSGALTKRNIPNFLLDKRAAGEGDLAVPTPDGTRLMANRRVVVEFRK